MSGNNPQDSAKFYAMYASHHTNSVNKILHRVVTPLIWLSGAAILDCIFTNLSFTISNHRIWFNPNTLLLVHFFYLVDHGESLPIFATAIVTWYIAGLALLLTEMVGTWIVWPMLLIHIGCWSAQVYGHAVLERGSWSAAGWRLSAIACAPYYCVLDLLFEYGWNPEYRKICEKAAKDT